MSLSSWVQNLWTYCSLLLVALSTAVRSLFTSGRRLYRISSRHTGIYIHTYIRQVCVCKYRCVQALLLHTYTWIFSVMLLLSMVYTWLLTYVALVKGVVGWWVILSCLSTHCIPDRQQGPQVVLGPGTGEWDQTDPSQPLTHPPHQPFAPESHQGNYRRNQLLIQYV